MSSWSSSRGLTKSWTRTPDWLRDYETSKELANTGTDSDGLYVSRMDYDDWLICVCLRTAKLNKGMARYGIWIMVEWGKWMVGGEKGVIGWKRDVRV